MLEFDPCSGVIGICRGEVSHLVSEEADTLQPIIASRWNALSPTR